MATSLAQLLRLAPAPAAPTHGGSLPEFAAIETALGTRLPSDFKLLLETYGTGSWLDFYWIVNPLDPRMSGFWLDSNHSEMRFWRELRHEDPKLIPFPIWPDPGGLLVWGGNENGGTLFWLTEGDPNTWPTVTTVDRTPEFDRFDQSCTDLLLGAVTKSNPVLAVVPWELASARGHDAPPLFSPY